MAYHAPNHSKFANAKFEHMASYQAFSILGESLMNRPIHRRMPIMASLPRLFPAGVGVNMLRYICLVYDKKSPFKVEYTMLGERKAAVAAFCGFKEGDGYYERIVHLDDEKVVDALCDFLKFQGDIKWALIIQYEEVFYNNEKNILIGVSSDKATDRMRAAETMSRLVKMNKDLAKDIAQLYVEFTGNDPDAEAAIKERRPISPETVPDYSVADGDYSPDWLEDEEE